jgi:biopolymer transport protein ExbD
MRVKLGLLVFYIFYGGLVHAQEPMKLFLPKKDTTLINFNYSYTVQTIIFSSDKLYCYLQKKIDSGQEYSLQNGNTFRNFILKNKRKFGDSLFVILKPAPTSTYTDVVNVLDEMSINKIKKFALVDLSDQEKNKFSILEPIEIQPSKVTSIQSAQPDSNNIWLLFELDSTPIISYSIKTQKDSFNLKVSKNQLEIQEVIAKAQSISNEQSKPLSVMIKGNSDIGYTEFEPLIEALKAKKIYKYKLITTPDRR